MTTEENSDLKELLYIVKSDPSMGHIGMAEMLQIHSKDIREIKNDQKKIQERNKVLYRVGVAAGGVITFVVGKSWGNLVVLLKGVF
jgi:hypothetical protein